MAYRSYCTLAFILTLSRELPSTMAAEKYSPASPVDYRNTLYEFRAKKKTSRLMQIADIYLWPMCIGCYDKGNRAYTRLLGAGKLIDCSLSTEDIPVLGIKYSCFDA